MAKLKKRKLRWEASTSAQVIGYKLYWSEEQVVHYGSESVVVGNVTELVLPDDVQDFKPSDGPVVFAVTAMDELGNESDLITLEAPYQFSVPEPPKDLWIETVADYYVGEANEAMTEQTEPIPLFEKRIQQLEEQLEAEQTKAPMLARGALKYNRGYDSGRISQRKG